MAISRANGSTSGATRSTSRATRSTSSIGSSSVVAIGCYSTTGLEIGAEVIGTGIKIRCSLNTIYLGPWLVLVSL